MPRCLFTTLVSTALLAVIVLAGCGGSTPTPPVEESDAPLGPPAAETIPEDMPDAPVQPVVEPVMDWQIIPSERVGPITAATTAADLVAAYGAAQVQDAPYSLGEGDSEPGTLIFPNDPAKRAAIRWNDLEKKERPLAVRIDGEGSQWKTAEGLSVGITLKRVEELNARPFRLYGFGWDYGGQLVDSNGGDLKDLPHEDPEGGFRGGALALTFQPDPAAAEKMSSSEYSKVAGDSVYTSDNPVMQALDPKVSAITILFPDAG